MASFIEMWNQTTCFSLIRAMSSWLISDWAGFTLEEVKRFFAWIVVYAFDWSDFVYVDLNISDLLSPVVNKNDYHMVRTPGQLLSLTSHLSFKSGLSPGSDRGQSPVFNTPEIMRDHRAYKENSFSFDLNGDFSVGASPPRSGDSFVSLKRKHETEFDEPDSQVQFKIPRTGLTEIFHFANLKEDSDIR